MFVFQNEHSLLIRKWDLWHQEHTVSWKVECSFLPYEASRYARAGQEGCNFSAVQNLLLLPEEQVTPESKRLLDEHMQAARAQMLREQQALKNAQAGGATSAQEHEPAKKSWRHGPGQKRSTACWASSSLVAASYGVCS